MKRAIRTVTRFKEFKTSSLYLGNALILDRSKVQEFGRLKDNI